ncbi:SKP1-like protein 1A [Phoenix dactylifera]|uniref:SKP1-like protein n=1 Tax=Phoenix dactylifera TaxID=42345 RepID=A0A8B8ZWL3_PHODC|nr:SKP1-like protein 1A [Phoenix dactylifera]
MIPSRSVFYPILLDFRFELHNPSIMAAEASASAAVEAPKTVVLKSSDGEEFEVESVVAIQSEMIKNMIEDGCAESSVPLPNVVGSVLAKVVEYWNRHGSRKSDGAAEGEAKELTEWEKEFVKVEKEELFELINAANFLSTKPLLDLCCQAVADTIKDMAVEDVRDYFGIESDFTPEEEAKIRHDISWAEMGLPRFHTIHGIAAAR